MDHHHHYQEQHDNNGEGSNDDATAFYSASDGCSNPHDNSCADKDDSNNNGNVNSNCSDENNDSEIAQTSFTDVLGSGFSRGNCVKEAEVAVKHAKTSVDFVEASQYTTRHQFLSDVDKTPRSCMPTSTTVTNVGKAAAATLANTASTCSMIA